MIAAATPQPALAELVRAGQWAEVRAAAEPLARPLPPEVALVVARAAARTGAAAEALRLLREALPHAGELAGALQLEAGEAALALGETPWPWVAELLRPGVPPEQRRAAGALLRRSWEELPLAAAQRAPSVLSSRALRRERAATLAVRTGDTAAALRLLKESCDDPPAALLASWLAPRAEASAGVRALVADALLTAGWWREADTVLAGTSAPVPAHWRSRLAYLRGRAAYRLGRHDEAAHHFDEALAAAATADDRFAAAVQRARLAELAGARSEAVPLWDTARVAAPREIEGWDGGARSRALTGRPGDALALLRRAPPRVLRVAGPRLAAVLIAGGQLAPARELLARLPRKQPVVQALAVALHVREGNLLAARAAARELLTSARGGPWRSLVLELMPVAAPAATAAPATRDPAALAALAVERGAAPAREALAAALALDPAWRPLLAGAPPLAPAWSGPAHDLAAVGLEREAAVLYPHRFPVASPVELAWSAAALAAWGNGPGALAAGERLAAALGNVPPAIVPEPLLPYLLPAALTAECAAAARAAGARASWLAAIVRRESRFDAAARSRAGAIGIAQVVPETARRLGAEPDELWERERSLALAARELARIAGRFGPRLGVVAAAYNAGDEVVASWLAALGGDACDLVFAAAVPYRETADYVLAVRDGAALARHLE